MPQGEHARVYNAPSVTELITVITGDDNATNIRKIGKLLLEMLVVAWKRFLQPIHHMILYRM